MIFPMSTMMVGEHQLLGNRIANLFFYFFCMILFQSLLVQKLLKIASFNFLSNGTSAWVLKSPAAFFGSIFHMCGECCLYLNVFQD